MRILRANANSKFAYGFLKPVCRATLFGLFGREAARAILTLEPDVVYVDREHQATSAGKSRTTASAPTVSSSLIDRCLGDDVVGLDEILAYFQELISGDQHEPVDEERLAAGLYRQMELDRTDKDFERLWA